MATGVDSGVIKDLKKKALQTRIDVLKMLCEAGSGHTGGSLSVVEILVSLYFFKMKYRSDQPKWPERDRFVLSKGHGAPALYSVLCRAGYFPEDYLNSLRKLGGLLQGHPESRMTPGVEVCTGSLGQGLSQANGIALALKMDGKPSRVYALMGDGELQEGQIWEAAMTSSHYLLDNLCAIVDHNKFQIDGPVEQIMSIYPLRDKWEAFGWYVEDIDGHNFDAIIGALKRAEEEKDRPSLIIANTVKGKGISFIEDQNKYHGVAPDKDELDRALAELQEAKLKL